MLEYVDVAVWSQRQALTLNRRNTKTPECRSAGVSISDMSSPSLHDYIDSGSVSGAEVLHFF